MDLKLTVRTGVQQPSELLAAYVKDINKEKPLTKQEEKDLFKEVELGKEASEILQNMSESDEDYAFYNEIVKNAMAARDKIIRSNQKFIYAIAKRYKQDDMILDLISEGNLGMLEAFDKFDSAKDVRFFTYASSYIERNISKFVSNGSVLIRRPDNILSNTKVAEFENRFFTENGRMPEQDETFEEMASRGSYFPRKEDMYDMSFLTIDYDCSDEDSDKDEDYQYQPRDYVNTASVENEYEESSEEEHYKHILSQLMPSLSEKEQKVIKLAFGIGTGREPMSNSEVATEIGMSSERARQLKNTALEKMRALAQNYSL